MEKNLFIKVILLFWIFFFFVPAFVGEPFRSLQRGVFFFLCGRYCRIYKPMQNVSKRFLFVLMILLLVVCSFASFAGDFVSTHFNIPAGLMKRFITGFRSGFLVPACTICIYQIFDSLDIGTINWINVIASGSFGVYLIHDSPIKILIWKIFRIENAWKSPFFIVFALSSCVFLFSICILIDLLREKVIKAIKK